MNSRVLGGLCAIVALGNVFDRLRYQAVPDFLDFHYGSYHWPSFNFADVAIFCGTAFAPRKSGRKIRNKTIAREMSRGDNS